MLEKKRDGGWGWLLLFLVLCCQVIVGGVCSSGGLFYIIFMDVFGSEPIETSWLCSLPMVLWFFASPVGGFLINRYDCRICTFIGGITATTGLILGYFASSIGYLFFSHGLLTGLGLGITFTALNTILNIYFDKFKTLAMGIGSIGINLGLVIYAKLIIYLEEIYGWRGMLLILGAITFHICTCAVAMFPMDKEIGLNIKDFKTPSSKSPGSLKNRSINLTLFKEIQFILFCVSNVFVNISVGIFILHLPSYSKDAGFTQENVGNVLMAYGILNCIGKVIYSVLGQHPRIDETSLYTVSLTVAGICIFLTPIFLTKIGIMVTAGLTGATSCVTGALILSVIYNIVGFERFTDGVGLSLPFKAVGNLIGGPLAGFLFTITSDYAFSFYLSGISMVIASLLMIQPVLNNKCINRQNHDRSSFTAEISNDEKVENKEINSLMIDEKNSSSNNADRHSETADEERKGFLVNTV